MNNSKPQVNQYFTPKLILFSITFAAIDWFLSWVIYNVLRSQLTIKISDVGAIMSGFVTRENIVIPSLQFLTDDSQYKFFLSCVFLGIMINLFFAKRAKIAPFYMKITFLITVLFVAVPTINIFINYKYYYSIINIAIFYYVFCIFHIAAYYFVSLIYNLNHNQNEFSIDNSVGPSKQDSVTRNSNFPPSQRLSRQAVLVDKTAYAVLVLIVFAICGTVVLILYAGQIVSSDTENTNVVSIAESKLSLVQKEYDIAEKRNINLVSELSLLKLEKDKLKKQVTSTNKSTSQKDKLYELLLKTQSNIEIQNHIIKLSESQIESIKKEITEAKKLVSDLIVKLSQRGNSNNSWTGSIQILLTAGLTRLAIMVLSIYLVRILVQLYQYNVRLAARYRTLSNALELQDLSPTKVTALSTALDASIEFSKPKFSDDDPIIAGFGGAIENLTATVKELSSKVRKTSAE